MTVRIISAIIIIVGFTAAAWLFSKIFYLHSSEPFQIQVVDETTKQPVYHALVSITWQFDRGHFQRDGYAHFHEGYTDEKGQLNVPGWGPKLYIRHWHEIGVDQPKIRLLLDSYLPKIVKGTPPKPELREGFNRPGFYNGEAIGLIPIALYPSEYSKLLGKTFNSLEMAWRGVDCGWREIPETIKWLSNRLDRIEDPNDLFFDPFGITGLGNQGKCGDAAQIVRSAL